MGSFDCYLTIQVSWFFSDSGIQHFKDSYYSYLDVLVQSFENAKTICMYTKKNPSIALLRPANLPRELYSSAIQ